MLLLVGMCLNVSRVSPPHYATLQIVDLDELSKAAGVVVLRSLGVAKGLLRKDTQVFYC